MRWGGRKRADRSIRRRQDRHVIAPSTASRVTTGGWGPPFLSAALTYAALVAPDTYNSSFNPNWICRDVVDVPVIRPAVGAAIADADVNTTVFGVPKFVRFRILKNSARNWRLTLSVIAVFFKTDKSRSVRPGPIRVFRPTSP